MELPVCEICAYTNNLCKNCKDKFKSGKINEIDIELSRILYSLAKHKNMDDVIVKRTINVDGLVVILVDSNPGILIGKQGRTIKRISQELGYKIRVINNKKNHKDQLSDLFWPIPILGVNDVFTPNEEYIKVRLPRNYAKRLPFSLDTLHQAASRLLDKKVKVIFE